ncbi:MAG: DMT family transporter [Bacillota bacterium]|nr:DMT family transporter [Bacillota bacterium]
MSKKQIGMLQMFCCAALWSIAGIFIKLINANPFVIAGFRSLFACITITIAMLIFKIKFKFTKSSVLNGIIMCVLFFMFVGSNKLTTAANAIVLEYTSPIFLMVFSALIYKKKFRKIDVLAAFFALIGIGCCFADKLESGYILGNIVAIGSGAVQALMYLFVGETKDDNERLTGIWLGQFLTACIGVSFIPYTENVLDSRAFLFLAILGVLQLGIPFVLYWKSAGNCPALACSLIAAVEPLLNPIWVAIFDGERPGTIAIIGGVVVIAAVTLWCIADAKLDTAKETA